MLDYRTHIVGLDRFREGLANAPLPPDLGAERDQILIDVALAPEHAQLGSLLDQMIAHAVSDGSEIALLERAAALWRQGVQLYDTLGTIRTKLETALGDPTAPGAADTFNAAAMESQGFAARLCDIEGTMNALRNDIDPMKHLPPHPRQLDIKADDWDWGNRFLGRRTEAFVRQAFRRSNDTATRAFAFGVLASYGTNAAGSGYLGHVTGGPRRSHRYRDRLARNTFGSYVAVQNPSIASLAKLSKALQFGSPAAPSLPPDIAQLLVSTLTDTFDLSRTPPIPDLDVGYRRLLRHLELLDCFAMPLPPAMPTAGFTQKLFGNPSKPPPSIRPQDVGMTQQDGSSGIGLGTSPGTNTPGSAQPGQDDSKKSSGSVCAAIVALIILFAILVIVSFISCVVEWAKGNKCNFFETLGDRIKDLFEQDPPDPRDPPATENPDMTAAGLAAFASTEQSTLLVGYFFDLQSQVWEALDSAYNYLAITGLIYPDRLLHQPRFAQFLKLPPLDKSWPRRAEPSPDETYHIRPNSPVEDPPKDPSPYPPTLPPFVVTDGLPGLSLPTSTSVAMGVWEQIVQGVEDSSNLDLDADRGFAHACWATRGSINDNPVDVENLAYDEQ
ncbi:hypothetical protein ACSHT2_28005 [Bradyrhizobium sp. PUT101]|uniref:hypothetical protein n=1 Tax=Bradyrhizobium sp. PUT101 TaxID=3447427 RepID=UPI003F82ADBF